LPNRSFLAAPQWPYEVSMFCEMESWAKVRKSPFITGALERL
jgi:hypothetical protein